MVCVLAVALVTLAACGGSSTSFVVTIAPTTATVPLLGTSQFRAAVSNATDMTVVWQVNGITGGNTACGTISTNGLYTAPAALPSSTTTCNGGSSTTNACSTTAGCVLITAISNQSMSATATASVALSSGVILTIVPTGVAAVGTGETLQFTATVNGSPTQTATWMVNGVVGGSATTGTITATPTQIAIYTAPATVPTPATVTVEAIATVDSTQTAIATVGIVIAANPVVTSVSPPNIPQGAFFQDLYLTGTNFLSTSSVLFGGVPLVAAATGTTVLRTRIPASMLTNAGPFSVVVQRQNGFTTPALTATVTPVRPALVTSLPDSGPQGSGSTTFQFNGGYYTPATTGDFEDQPRPFTLVNPRSAQLTLSASDFTTAGLFSVGLSNATATPPRSAVNIAVQPTAAPVVTNTIHGFNQPVAVAVNNVTGIPVVVNQGSNTLALLDSSFTTIVGPPVAVGTSPTAVAVDSVRNLAFVADNGSNDVDVVDLSGPTVVATLTTVGVAPFAVGADGTHGRAIVVDQNANAATILDTTVIPPKVLGTVNVSTGTKPQVDVLPQLGWAVVTPGGAGPISVVDLVRMSLVFTVNVTAGIQGVGINSESKTMLLVDPSLATASLFSLTDQSVLSSITLQQGNVAAAVNPLTNVGVTVNPSTHQAFVINLESLAPAVTVTLGTNPVAVFLDAGTNSALVADSVDNTVTVINLGPIRSTLGEPQITDTDPIVAFTSGVPVPVVVTGAGFVPGAQIRLDQTAVTTTFVNSRQLTANIPISFLGQARRIVLDVQNSPGVVSNVSNISVVQPVPVGNSPQAVAIDSSRDLAIVTNAADNTVSIVDINTGNVTTTIPVGISPQGVAVSPRAGRVVVANTGSGTASILDLTTDTVVATVSVGGQPLGVAISEDSGLAVVANSASNSISAFGVTGTGTPAVSSIAVGRLPLAVAIAPELGFAAVANGTSNDVDVVNIALATPFLFGTVSNLSGPTGATYDPVLQEFIIVSSLSNNIVVINAQTAQSVPPPGRVGVNPTSVAYNFQSSTLLTLNTSSNTLSVMDFPAFRVRDVVPFSGSSLFAVAIHPRLNVAVVVDAANNRILLVPISR
jgi:YVTN family beta-propeller protein